MDKSNGVIQTTMKQGRFCTVMPVDNVTLAAVLNLVLESLEFRPEPKFFTMFRFVCFTGNRLYPKDVTGLRMLLASTQRILRCVTIRSDGFRMMHKQVTAGVQYGRSESRRSLISAGNGRLKRRRSVKLLTGKFSGNGVASRR